MAEALSAEIKSSLVWLFQDVLGLTTIADSSSLAYDAQLTNGTGTGQADALWHELRTVAAADNDDLSLSALPQTIFGNSVTIELAAVKAVLIVNTETNAGEDLLVGGAAATPWGAPFGAAGHQVRVPADSCLLLVNKSSGWDVASGSAETLRIANVGTDAIAYKIVVVGIRA